MEGYRRPLGELMRELRQCGLVIDYDYARPLPTPPAGYTWRQLSATDAASTTTTTTTTATTTTIPGQTWQLFQMEDAIDASTVKIDVDAITDAVIEHVILPNDTLQGICLRYRVSAVELRQWNNFSGNTIKHLALLKIPVSHGQPIQRQDDESPEIIVQRFKTRTKEATNEAVYYLAQNEWNLENALKHWKSDTNWSEETIHIPNFADMVPDDDNTEESSVSASRGHSNSQETPNKSGSSGGGWNILGGSGKKASSVTVTPSSSTPSSNRRISAMSSGSVTLIPEATIGNNNSIQGDSDEGRLSSVVKRSTGISEKVASFFNRTVSGSDSCDAMNPSTSQNLREPLLNVTTNTYPQATAKSTI